MPTQTTLRRALLRSPLVVFLFCGLALTACGGGSSSSSSGGSSTGGVADTFPDAPTNISASGSNGQIALAWTAPPNAQTYSVYIGTSSGAESGSAILTGITSPTATISGLSNGQIYFLTVVASNSTGSSAPSTEVAGVPIAPSVSTGTLATGVMVLPDATNSQIVSENSSTVTFNGAVTIPAGTVFLTANGAYIADSSASSSGQTVVIVHSPQVQDIFSELHITGTYPIDSSTPMVAASQSEQASEADRIQIPVRAKVALSGSLQQMFPLKFSQNGFSANGNLTAAIAADLDYNVSNGALQQSHLTVNESVSAKLTVGFDATTKLPKIEIPVGTYAISVPVSLVDSLLRAVGVKTISIQVPVKFKLSASSAFGPQATVNESAQVSGSLAFIPGQSPTLVLGYTGSSNIDQPTPGPDEGLTEASAKGSVSLDARPAVAFLNSVALAGADIDGAIKANVYAQFYSNKNPDYCIQAQTQLVGTLSGFFKSLATKEIMTGDISKSVPGPVLPSFGSCGADSTLIATINSSFLPATYFQQIEVDVSVSPAPSSAAAGKVPSGTVSVTVGDQPPCTVTLDASGNGSCSLAASPAGTALLAAAYSGDASFNTSTFGSSVNIAQANTTTAVTAPSTTTIGSPTSITVSTVPSPNIDGQFPTGEVDVTDGTGKTLCQIPAVQSGAGSCNVTFTAMGPQTITATYQGDTNFSGSEGTAPISVIPPGGKFWSGTYQITSCNNPNDAGGGYSGQGSCDYQLSYVIGSPGGIEFRENSSESMDLRRDFTNGSNVATCDRDTESVSTQSSGFTFIPANSGNSGPAQFNFNITSVTDSHLEGTISGTFTYEARPGGMAGQCPCTTETGTFVGTWSADTQATPFPKCLPYSDGDSTDYCYEGASCYLPPYDTAPDGEWIGFP